MASTAKKGNKIGRYEEKIKEQTNWLHKVTRESLQCNKLKIKRHVFWNTS